MTELYDALEKCLEEMAAGTSLETALGRYPRLASELRPLLEAAGMARQAGRIQVPAEARRDGRLKLMGRVHEARPAGRPRRILPVFPRVALTAGLVAVLVLTSTGLVSASSTSLPGQQLYPVKRTWESVRLWFAVSPQERDLIESGYEQERLDEISELLGRRISAPIMFSGLLSRQADGQWLISGIPVEVTSGTSLPAAPIVQGAPVTVTGMTRLDGVVEAHQIQVLQPGASLPPFEPSERNEAHDSEDGEDGAHGAVPTSQPAPDATRQASPQPASTQTTYQFSGVVQSIQGDRWTINGQPVYVDSAQIDLQVTVGAIVRFQGYYGEDGRFMVTTVEPYSAHSGDRHNGSDGSGDHSSGGEGESEGGEDGP